MAYSHHDTPDNGHWKYVLVCLTLSVGIIQGDEGQACTVTLNEPYGIIMSDGYPKLYHSKPCTWNINVGKGNNITLSILDIDLSNKEKNECVKDFLKISPVAPPHNEIKLCERTDLFEVQSPAESMTVELISSSLSSSKRGFVAEYHASDVTVNSKIIISVMPGSPSGKFVIQCDNSSGRPTDTVKSYYLSRLHSQATDYSELAYLDTVNTILLRDINPSVHAEGSIYTSLQLIFKEATCNDSGIYRCLTTFTSVDTTTKTYEDYTSVYISTDPSPANLTITPIKMCYSYGTEVTLRCSIQSGSVLKGFHRELVWQSRIGETSWKPFTLGTINTQQPNPDDNSDECNLIKRSELVLKADERHNGLQIRCIIREYGNILYSLNDGRDFTNSPIVRINETRDLKIPGQIMLWAEPNSPSVAVFQEVLLICQGSVGYDTDVETLWKWEYRNKNNQNWTEYLETSDWRTIKAGKSTNECDFVETSILTLVVTENDNNHEYRCSVVKKSADGSTSIYPSTTSYVIRVRVLSFGAADDLDVHGAYVGIVFGSLLIVVIGVSIACYLWHIYNPSEEEAPKYVPSAVFPEKYKPMVRKDPGKTLSFNLQEMTYEYSSDFRKVSSSVDPPRYKL